ncbi:DUF2183 domain-containing protein [Tamlana sp. s12]|uniref:phosphatase domain-containing protein n=1 Tax=Tamlana sp. s12 TaxID=1630406 RepID=UPI0007FBEE22|nr:phosphatase domain-containing protein [Tamlana sp. s12]OBQ56698.1 hypothetical protein VQ01_05025 [Tamlana sp. s12]QQY81656.1 DUF2183 domain-containing protein [Tamlana sp. s12]
MPTKITLVQGILLKNNTLNINKSTSVLKHLMYVLKAYTLKPIKHTNLNIFSNNKLYSCSTDNTGAFTASINTPLKDFDIYISGNKTPLKTVQSYPTHFQHKDYKINVISDIDDTILVSYTAKIAKRIKTLLLTHPSKRKTIAYTKSLLDFFSKNDIGIYYLSKSESNFFQLLTHFITHHNLPKGPLLLTPFLNFKQLLMSSKNKAYKITHLRLIFKNSPNQRFALIGDDSQKDLEVYYQIAKEYPEQVLKIYIRITNDHINKKQHDIRNKYQNLQVPVTYFKTQDEIDLDNELQQLIQKLP